MDELSQDKVEFLKNIGAVDISNYKYLIPHNCHLYSLEYLVRTPLRQIINEYEELYSDKQDIHEKNRRRGKKMNHVLPMEIRIEGYKLSDIRKAIEEVKKMEKEYSCHCTLLVVELKR